MPEVKNIESTKMSTLFQRALPTHSTLPKNKSATLSPPSLRRSPIETNNELSNSSENEESSKFTSMEETQEKVAKPDTKRNHFRRSFTLPRSLMKRKSGQTGPASENSRNFVKNIFLTLVKSKGTSSPANTKESDTSNLTNGTSNTNNSSAQSIPLPPGFVPAAVGLKNQGNTCFMNAIVQCLSHTDILARYLVTDAYKNDLRKKYWIRNGKGEVTEELASILKSTWFRMNSSVLEEAASKFKSAVEKGAAQWRGSEQHDAQEFLIWLLDRLHEDLNQAASNKYKPVKNNFGRPDEQVAAEALANHVRCNNSIIHEIFGAQFRSSLTCPGCGRQSATFDPFLCVSLPIPEAKEQVPVYVNILYLTQQPRLVKLGISLNANADIKELKELLSFDTEINENEIILTEIDGEGFHRTFTESQYVSVLSNNEAVYCIETPKIKEVNETELNGAFIMIAFANILVTDDCKIRFGSPYITQVSREIGYQDLQKLLIKEMATVLQSGVLVNEQVEPVFNIRVLDGSTNGCLIDPNLEHPLYMEAVDDALSLCDKDVPPHIKVHLEFSPENKEKILADDSETVEEHSSVSETRSKHCEERVSRVSLDECFDLYTRAEELSAEDSWHCPHCNRKEQGTLKMIALWSAPQILVVHLKRFRQGTKLRASVSKISSIVDFPIDFLDLNPHVSKRNNCRNNVGGGGGSEVPETPESGALNAASPLNGCFSLWKSRASFKQSKIYTRMSGTENLVYDLFAVCNHHGKDLQGGHYTAYCKNPVDSSWWSFDDTRVTQLSSVENVQTSSAYILFYQRRNSLPLNNIGANSATLTNHWCRTLLSKHYKNTAVSNNNFESKNGKSEEEKAPLAVLDEINGKDIQIESTV